MAVLAKGTFLYFINPTDDSVVRFFKPKSIPELTAPRTEIDTTSIEDDGPQYQPGEVAPGETQVGADFTPGEVSHELAMSLYADDNAPILRWAIGWPGSTDLPVVDVGGDVFDEAAAARSFTYFDGYIKDLPHAFQIGQFVSANMTIRRSGRPRYVKST